MTKKELNNKSTFGDIKKWFDQNLEFLPTTLDADHIYYNNVPGTVEIYIYQVVSEFERLGPKGIKRSAVARSGKNNLYQLYLNLQDTEKWDLPKPKLKFS